MRRETTDLCRLTGAQIDPHRAGGYSKSILWRRPQRGEVFLARIPISRFGALPGEVPLTQFGLVR